MLVELFRMEPAPTRIVVTVQLEVAERLAAGPGTPGRGLLSVWAQLGYEVAIRKKISPTCFWPVPGVWSAIVDMRRVVRPPASACDLALFYALTRLTFTHRRKQIPTSLGRADGDLHLPAARAQEILAELGLDPKSRPEDLSVEEWCAFSNRMAEETKHQTPAHSREG